MSGGGGGGWGVLKNKNANPPDHMCLAFYFLFFKLITELIQRQFTQEGKRARPTQIVFRNDVTVYGSVAMISLCIVFSFVVDVVVDVAFVVVVVVAFFWFLSFVHFTISFRAISLMENHGSLPAKESRQRQSRANQTAD